MTHAARNSVAGERPALEDVTGVVLCGGASRRMGRDKASIEIDGESLVARTVRVMEQVSGHVILATGEGPRFPELGREVALDEVPGAGPLAGLAAGLAAARTPWVAFAPCDLPCADPRIWHLLLERAVAQDLDVCRYQSPRGVEPTVCVVRPSVLPAVRAALAAGERKLVAFDAFPLPSANDKASRGMESGGAESRVRPGVVLEETLSERYPELAHADPTLNVNTPEDLARALRPSIAGSPSMALEGGTAS